MISNIELLDICFPDSFQGDSRIVLAIPCWVGMTYSDLETGLKETSNQSDYGIDDWLGFNDEVQEFFSDVHPDDIVAELNDFEESDDYTPYAYFALDQCGRPHIKDSSLTYLLRL